MIRGAAEACAKLAALSAASKEADRASKVAEKAFKDADKARMDKLLIDVAAACDSLCHAKSRPDSDVVQDVFQSVMNSPM